MGDPVGNFHYVEKRLKQGITVSRGGEGGGGVASNRNPKETPSRCRNGLIYNVSKEEREREKKNSHPYSNKNTAMVCYNGK